MTDSIKMDVKVIGPLRWALDHRNIFTLAFAWVALKTLPLSMLVECEIAKEGCGG